jgi:uncharacterized membrane protein
MTEQSTADGRGRRAVWMRPLLIVSLAVNLLVAGVVLGALVRGGGSHRDFGPSGRDPVLPYTRALSQEQRHALRDDLAQAFGRGRGEAFGQGRDGRGALVQSFDAALTVLRSDPFDAAAMQEILRRQAELTDLRRRLGEEVLAAHLARLSPEERRAYADRLEAELSRLRGRKGHASGQKPRE